MIYDVIQANSILIIFFVKLIIGASSERVFVPVELSSACQLFTIFTSPLEPLFHLLWSLTQSTTG